jgi:hypothetical protein
MRSRRRWTPSRGASCSSGDQQASCGKRDGLVRGVAEGLGKGGKEYQWSVAYVRMLSVHKCKDYSGQTLTRVWAGWPGQQATSPRLCSGFFWLNNGCGRPICRREAFCRPPVDDSGWVGER